MYIKKWEKSLTIPLNPEYSAQTKVLQIPFNLVKTDSHPSLSNYGSGQGYSMHGFD